MSNRFLNLMTTPYFNSTIRSNVDITGNITANTTVNATHTENQMQDITADQIPNITTDQMQNKTSDAEFSPMDDMTFIAIILGTSGCLILVFACIKLAACFKIVQRYEQQSPQSQRVALVQRAATINIPPSRTQPTPVPKRKTRSLRDRYRESRGIRINSSNTVTIL